MTIVITVLFLHTFILRHNRAPRPRYRPIQLEIQLYIDTKNGKLAAHLPWSSGGDCYRLWSCVSREETAPDVWLHRNGLIY